MKISVEWLQGKGACSEGMKWFGKKETALKKLVDRLIKAKKWDWSNWLIKYSGMGKTQSVKVAIFAAEQVIGVYEKQYPNDNRPRKAIEAAKMYLSNPSAAAANAAAAAANAAATAAYAADKDAIRIKILKYFVEVMEVKS